MAAACIWHHHVLPTSTHYTALQQAGISTRAQVHSPAQGIMGLRSVVPVPTTVCGGVGAMLQQQPVLQQVSCGC